MDTWISMVQFWNFTTATVNITSFPDITLHRSINTSAVQLSSGNIAANNAATEAISCQQISGENVPFPSCYSWPQIILFAFFMAVVMFVIVFGNLLVIISIMTNTSLKTVQNYLLVSLAIADCMVGALIMPFSLANELMGYWAFGDILCDSWLALDVLLCTASIFSLCAISLDRYWSVTQAVTYLQKRTPKRAAQMIFAVWAFSLMISVPPLFGWRNPPNMTEIVTFSNETMHETSLVKTCSVGEDTSEYVIFSSLGSFWIPLAVMTVVYVRIYMVARSRASGPAAAHAAGKPGNKLSTAPSSGPSPSIPAIKVDNNNHQKKSGNYQSTMPVIADTHCPSSTVTSTYVTSSKGMNSERKPLLAKPSLQPEVSDQHTPLNNDESNSYPDSRSPSSEDTPSTSSEKNKSRTKHHGNKRDVGTQTETVIQDEERPGYIDDDEYAETSSIMLLSEFDFDKRWKDFFDKYIAPKELLARETAAKPPMDTLVPNGSNLVTAEVAVISCESVPFWNRLRQFFTSLLLWRQHSTNSTRGYHLQVNKEPHRKISRKKAKKRVNSRKGTGSDLQDEADRRKRRIQKAKERRATLVVTLVIATFVACWMPFFIILPLQAICGQELCSIHPKIFASFFWLGYFNSALNPVIYTIFNRDMRKAFKKILLGTDYARKREIRQHRAKN